MTNLGNTISIFKLHLSFELIETHLEFILNFYFTYSLHYRILYLQQNLGNVSKLLRTI